MIASVATTLFPHLLIVTPPRYPSLTLLLPVDLRACHTHSPFNVAHGYAFTPPLHLPVCYQHLPTPTRLVWTTHTFTFTFIPTHFTLRSGCYTPLRAIRSYTTPFLLHGYGLHIFPVYVHTFGYRCLPVVTPFTVTLVALLLFPFATRCG